MTDGRGEGGDSQRGTFMRLRKETVIHAHDGQVRLRRDSHGVPVVLAQTAVDGAFGLGWIHARDRQLQSLLGREMLNCL